MTLALFWLQFAAASVITLGASHFLTRSADVIAFKTGLGRSFIGIALLATATSLPELGTSISSVALIGEPDLAAGTIFGSNLFNLFIIGLLDILWRDGPILSRVGKTPVVIGGLGIAIISLAAAAIFIHTTTATMSGWYISPISVVIFVVFLAAMYMLFRFERSQERDSPPEANHEYALASLSVVVLTYLLSAAVIGGAAIWLASTADHIAEEMGWEASYVGTQFLAFSTSLPELATSVAAIRLFAPELAIANLLGSTLFNTGLILFLVDLAYPDGVLWAAISQIHILTAAIAVIMTSVVIVALLKQRRRRPGRFWTVESVVLIGLYLAASVLVFYLG
ncbi:MAG: sodium:calcium antiporter [Chloroflexi bacterium]|nr:sodium:calcium antiporter [Chloroflexota bacterium]